MNAPSSSEDIRLAVIGAGLFGEWHIRTCLETDGITLAAVIDRDAQALARLADTLPATVHTDGDIESAQQAVAIDGWIVATSTASHVPIAHQLLGMGQFVLCEKPLSDRVEAALSLQDLPTERLMMGHLLLFRREFNNLLNLREGRGRIRYIDCVRHRDTDHRVRFPNESPLHLTMVHDLYMVYVLMEGATPAQYQTVMGSTGASTDVVSTRLTWPDGTVASLTASFLIPNAMPPEYFDRLELFADGWLARLRPAPEPLEWSDGSGDLQAVANDNPTPFTYATLADELKSFSAVIRGEHPVPFGARYEDAMTLQTWMDKIAAAWKRDDAQAP